MSWAPIVSFFVLTVIFALGNEVSLKTKAIISLMIVSCTLYLIGYWTGIIPLDSITSTGLPTILAAFILPIGVTNLGTMIDINQFLSEWKTVLICLFAMVGLAVMSFTVGTWIFGREYALVAAAPIAGGGIATTIIGAACEEAGRPELAGYAALLNALQILVSMPIASFMLKLQLNDMQKKGLFESEEKLRAGEIGVPNLPRHSLKNMPEWWTRPYPILARVSLMAVIAYAINYFTGIPQAISCLVLGVLACHFGFLEPSSLQKAGFWGFVMLTQLCNMPRMLSAVTWQKFTEMIIPVFGMLILGAMSLMIFGMIMGRILRLPVKATAAVSLCAMLGYPPTMLIAQDAVETMVASEEEKKIALGYTLPKMLIGGFTTVSTASVAFASIIAPLIF